MGKVAELGGIFGEKFFSKTAHLSGASREETTAEHAAQNAKNVLGEGGLPAHEGLGHTIENHVGKTDEQMKERLEKEGKGFISTFETLDSAEKVLTA